MASVGQELKRERELRGISLKEIADTTKINIRFLRALEEDRFDMLPEQFFTRGIIRTYANYLGLDEQSVLNTYLEASQGREKVGMSDENKRSEPKENDDSLPNMKKSRFLFAITVLLLVGLTVILYVVFRKKEPPPPDIAKVQSVSQNIPEKQSPPSPAVQEEQEIEQEGLTIEIFIRQETWIEVFADQEMLDSGIKYPDERFQFKALQEFLIHVGNAGGITYTINGHEGISLGDPGTVRRDIRITLENYQEFIIEEES